MSIAGSVAAIVLFALGAMHAYWAAGGELGKQAAVPMRNGKPVLHPTPLVTWAVSAGLFALALLVTMRIGRGGEYSHSVLLRAIIGSAGAVFVLRALGDFRYVGFFKTVRAGRFAQLDTMAYSPLSLLLGISIIKCAIG